MRPLVATVAILLAGWLCAGCATHPLGQDWGKLDPEARDARVRKTLEGLIAGGVSGDGEPFTDREVISCTLDRVVYQPSEGVGPVSSLRWIDVRSVTGQPETTLPSRPETLFLYLHDDSPSTKSVKDLTEPVLSKVGVVSTYLLLRNRPRRSRVALIRCLDYLRKKGLKALVDKQPAKPKAGPAAKPKAGPAAKPKAAEPAKPKPAEPKPVEPAAPKAKPLEAVEAKLEKLKSWREKGLITEQEYQSKKAELLKGL